MQPQQQQPPPSPLQPIPCERAAAVRRLLQEAHAALAASDAAQALQSVVEALRLLQGSEGVLPALQAAALLHHQAQAVPISDLSRLLAQVSLCAAAQSQPTDMQHQEQQHAQDGMAQLSLQQQQQQQASSSRDAAMSEAGQDQQQQYRQQQQSCLSSILQESGRASFAEAALADGSSWRCPHCEGVVPMARQQAHLLHWCPRLQGAMQ